MATKVQLKYAYGDATSSIGIPMSSEKAKELDGVIKNLPQECREQGLKHVHFYQKKLDFNLEERTDVSLITNDTIDRDNEVVLPKGLDWRQFKMTGMPVTWAHDYTSLPVGRSLGIWKHVGSGKAKTSVGDGWMAKTVYATRPPGWEGPWLPDGIVGMIDQNMLSGKSIGYMATELSSPTPDDIRARPELANVDTIIRKAIVIEYAVAPIQANYQAVISGTKSFNKDLTDSFFEHMGIILPSNSNEFIEIPEITCEEHKGTYKVISEPSFKESLIKMLKR